MLFLFNNIETEIFILYKLLYSCCTDMTLILKLKNYFQVSVFFCNFANYYS